MGVEKTNWWDWEPSRGGENYGFPIISYTPSRGTGPVARRQLRNNHL